MVQMCGVWFGTEFTPWQAPFGPTTRFTVFCTMALLLQSFRGVALSYVHGLYAHWQIELILDRIRSFLGPTDLQMLNQPCPMPHGHSDVCGNTEEGTMDRTWSSAPSTPRRRRHSRHVLQVALGVYIYIYNRFEFGGCFNVCPLKVQALAGGPGERFAE